MSIRIGFLGVAHVHAGSFAQKVQAHPRTEFVGCYDHDLTRGEDFAKKRGARSFSTSASLLESVDAVIVASENLRHAGFIEEALGMNRHVLCEKPLAASESELTRIQSAAAKSSAMLSVAFPCPFSPSFEKALTAVQNGSIGRILAINATNRGTFPGSWFADPAESGGGALADHVVHVADLIFRLLNQAPESVSASKSHVLNQMDAEDGGMVLLRFPGGVFATIDSSWSFLPEAKTWGDVTLSVVGEEGVIEVDVFAQGLDFHRKAVPNHRHASFASDLDRLMVADFVHAIENGTAPRSGLAHGLESSRVFLAAKRSAEISEPITVSA